MQDSIKYDIKYFIIELLLTKYLKIHYKQLKVNIVIC